MRAKKLPHDSVCGATFSRDGLHRYILTRRWGSTHFYRRSRWTIVFIGLNPATADATAEDNTVVRCINTAVDMGFTEFHMLNLFSWRATAPKEVKKQITPTNDRNDEAIIRTIQLIDGQSPVVVCCWGADGGHKDRNVEVMRLLRSNRVVPYCFCTTASGHPRHPLYLPKETPLQLFSPDFFSGGIDAPLPQLEPA